MPIRWDDKNCAKLLRIVTHHIRLTKQDMTKLAEEMGEGCTWKSIEGFLHKLRKEAKAKEGAGVQNPPATPTKKSNSHAPSSATPNKGDKGDAAAVRDGAPFNSHKKRKLDGESLEGTGLMKEKERTDGRSQTRATSSGVARERENGGPIGEGENENMSFVAIQRSGL